MGKCRRWGDGILVSLFLAIAANAACASWISDSFGGSDAPERQALAAMERAGMKPDAVVVKIDRTPPTAIDRLVKLPGDTLLDAEGIDGKLARESGAPIAALQTAVALHEYCHAWIDTHEISLPGPCMRLPDDDGNELFCDAVAFAVMRHEGLLAGVDALYKVRRAGQALIGTVIDSAKPAEVVQWKSKFDALEVIVTEPKTYESPEMTARHHALRACQALRRGAAE
jgi:hypothetical protein